MGGGVVRDRSRRRVGPPGRGARGDSGCATTPVVRRARRRLRLSDGPAGGRADAPEERPRRLPPGRTTPRARSADHPYPEAGPRRDRRRTHHLRRVVPRRADPPGRRRRRPDPVAHARPGRRRAGAGQRHAGRCGPARLPLVHQWDHGRVDGRPGRRERSGGVPDRRRLHLGRQPGRGQRLVLGDVPDRRHRDPGAGHDRDVPGALLPADRAPGRRRVLHPRRQRRARPGRLRGLPVRLGASRRRPDLLRAGHLVLRPRRLHLRRPTTVWCRDPGQRRLRHGPASRGRRDRSGGQVPARQPGELRAGAVMWSDAVRVRLVPRRPGTLGPSAARR